MITIEQFKELQFKIARVVEARPHPNADRLLLLTLDTGEVRKEVVAGIALHYKPEQLIGKQVVLLDNLQPATIRGVVSNGMVLAAQDGQRLALVTPEKQVQPGAVVR